MFYIIAALPGCSLWWCTQIWKCLSLLSQHIVFNRYLYFYFEKLCYTSIVLRLKGGCIMCVSVRSRLNKKWSDKAAVPYLLHEGHLKTEHRKSVRVCWSLRYMSEHEGAAVNQMFVVFAFALFIYSFIYLFSGERDYLWIMEQSPFSP